MSSQLYTDLLGLPVKRSLSLEFSLDFRAWELSKNYTPNVWTGMFVDLVCFSKGLRAPKLLTIPAVVKAPSRAGSGAVTRFQRRFGIY